MKAKSFLVLLILLLALPLAVSADTAVVLEVTPGVRALIAPTDLDCGVIAFSWSAQANGCVFSGGNGAAGDRYQVSDAAAAPFLGSHLVINGVSDFEGVDPLNTFSIENLAVKIVDPIVTIQGDAVLTPLTVAGFEFFNSITMIGVSPLSAAPGAGLGVYNVFVEAMVTIPAGQVAENYSAVIASNYLSGP